MDGKTVFQYLPLTLSSSAAVEGHVLMGIPRKYLKGIGTENFQS
jgi:hypothetical protein